MKLEKANLERKLAQVQSQRSLHKKGDLVNQYTNSILSAKEKVKLFRNIFKGREDLYAIRWSSKDGKFGYTAACRNEWVRELCKKPCHNCLNRDLLPLTDQVIYDHLAGKKTIGIYPLLLDDRCYF